jgi:flavin reductase (DIM6/NTAB) family NADH-FMN oxidoreductase RutF
LFDDQGSAVDITSLEPSASDFRRSMIYVPTSVVVASAMVNGEPVGMVVGTFTSVSMEPPLVGFFGSDDSMSLSALLKADVIAFSLLSQDDEAVCDAFRLPMQERFEHTPWHVSEYGAPVVDDAPLTLHTTLYDSHQVGDHRLLTFVVHVAQRNPEHSRPLLYYRRQLSRLDPVKRVREEMWQLGWRDDDHLM